MSPTGAVDHRLGHGPARQRRHQRRPRGPPRHHRRLDRDALGHPGAPHRRHGVVAAIDAGAAPSSVPALAPGAGRPPRAGHLHPRPGRPGHLGRGAPRPRAHAAGPSTSTPRAPASSTRWWRPTARQLRRGAPGPAHRRRLRVAASPTPTTAPPPCSSPTAPARWCSKPSDEDGLLAVDLGVDGSAHDLLTCAHGGYMQMEGKEVFRRAVRITVESASNALERAKLAPDDIALFVPHQANLRIIEAAASRLGIPMDRVAVVVDRTGQHLERLDPPGPGRRRRRRTPRPGRPRPHVGLRRRDDLGQHPGALGDRHRRAGHDDERRPTDGPTPAPGGAGWCWSPAARAGIGLACARRFQALGDRVAVTYRTAPPTDWPGPARTPSTCCRCPATSATPPRSRRPSRPWRRPWARRGAGRQRRGHQGHAPAAHGRGGVERGHRHQPDRRLPGGAAGPRAHGAGPPGPDRAHLVGGRLLRVARARSTTARPRPAWSAWPGPWPARSGAGASP